jgi:hypothetical protein
LLFHISRTVAHLFNIAKTILIVHLSVNPNICVQVYMCESLFRYVNSKNSLKHDGELGNG